MNRKVSEGVNGGIDADVQATWASEIERRLAKIESGRARWLSIDEAIARMHRAVRGR